MGAYTVPLLGGLVIYAVIHTLVRAPGRALQRKFAKANPLAGKTYAEVIAAVGEPQSRSVTADGGRLMQWQATGYHVALRFGPDEVCLGVTHEFAAR